MHKQWGRMALDFWQQMNVLMLATDRHQENDLPIVQA
jgi:hypothetical protein